MCEQNRGSQAAQSKTSVAAKARSTSNNEIMDFMKNLKSQRGRVQTFDPYTNDCRSWISRFEMSVSQFGLAEDLGIDTIQYFLENEFSKW